MFSLNAFIINNKTIGNCKWILIIAFLQDLFHFLGLNRKLFANGFKGFMVKNSHVNISVRKEIASQVLKKPFVLKQEKYGILMLLNTDERTDACSRPYTQIWIPQQPIKKTRT